LPHGTGGRNALERGCAAAGVRPRVAFEAGDPRVLMELARRGLGLAILPASAPENLHAIRIRPVLRSRLELAWRAGTMPSPAARRSIASPKMSARCAGSHSTISSARSADSA